VTSSISVALSSACTVRSQATPPRPPRGAGANTFIEISEMATKTMVVPVLAAVPMRSHLSQWVITLLSCAPHTLPLLHRAVEALHWAPPSQPVLHQHDLAHRTMRLALQPVR
jgi:hypothetical protein